MVSLQANLQALHLSEVDRLPQELASLTGVTRLELSHCFAGWEQLLLLRACLRQLSLESCGLEDMSWPVSHLTALAALDLHCSHSLGALGGRSDVWRRLAPLHS